jgi:hypothetical protein
MAEASNSDPLVDPLVDTAAGTDGDWPAQVTATVVEYVGKVRDKTTGPALVASRVAVYSLALGLISVVLAFLALILLVRVLVVATTHIPGVEEGEPWLAYLILGVLFLGNGLVLWRKKEG